MGELKNCQFVSVKFNGFVIQIIQFTGSMYSSSITLKSNTAITFKCACQILFHTFDKE